MLERILIAARQLLLPAHCAACGAPAPADVRLPLCEACSQALTALLEAPACPRCGRTTAGPVRDPDGCGACRGHRLAYDGAVRVGPYEEPLRSLILRYKYERRAELAPMLGRLLAERLAAAPWRERVDLVVPVPLHWTRRIRRGFNQAARLAAELTGACGRRVAGRRLLRVRPTPHQTRLPAGERGRNVRGAFAVRRRAADLKGRAVLLVDDVLTSGATAGECARTLKKAGAAEVYLAIVAAASHDEPGPW